MSPGKEDGKDIGEISFKIEIKNRPVITGRSLKKQFILLLIYKRMHFGSHHAGLQYKQRDSI